VLGRLAALVPADWHQRYGIRSTASRLSSIRPAFAARVIARRTGSGSAEPPGGAPQRPDQPADAAGQRGFGVSPGAGLPRTPDEDSALSRRRRTKPRSRAAPPRIALRFEELGAIVERAKAALSADELATLKAAMDTLASAELETKQTSLDGLRRLLFGTTTEKTRTRVGGADVPGPGPCSWPWRRTSRRPRGETMPTEARLVRVKRQAALIRRSKV
jgi:hypothetical protein